MIPYEGLVIDYNQDDWGQITLEDHSAGAPMATYSVGRSW